MEAIQLGAGIAKLEGHLMPGKAVKIAVDEDFLLKFAGKAGDGFFDSDELLLEPKEAVMGFG